ncbi:histidine phosphatase family protein [soil metagenome]
MGADELRTLIILRHAKTERDHVQGDWHRRLTERGHRDARGAAEAILSVVEGPIELVLSSDAVRAIETAQIIKQAIAPEAPFLSRRSIYLADTTDLINELQAVDNLYRTALLVGHNPGFLDLINWFAGDRGGHDHLPTSGFTVVTGSWRTWADAGSEGATLTPIISQRRRVD